MSSVLRTSPRSTPQPAAAAQPRRQPRQKGGRFGKADGTASAQRKATASGCRKTKQRRDVKIVRPLDAPTAAAIVSFLNEELGDVMIGWVLAHTELGKQAGGKNIWSRPR